MTRPHYQEIADARREEDAAKSARFAELFEQLEADENERAGDGRWLGWAIPLSAGFWLGLLVWWLV